MRIVFIGAVDFSRHCLEEVLRQSGHVVAVLNPEHAHARFNSDYADLAPVASACDVPLYRVGKIGDPEAIELIRSLRPDVIFVFGFSQLIPAELLQIPPLGCIGTHPALLPRNRGRHPLIWALVEGLSESGLTFFYLDEGIDSGDILWQKPFPITLDDDAGTLQAKIKELATEAIRVFLPQLEKGIAPRRPQDHSLATYWRKRTRADGEINWAGPTLLTYNLLRALTRPYVGAHTFLENKEVIVWRSRLLSAPAKWHGEPGEIVDKTPVGFVVRCGDGALELTEWECTEGVNLWVGARLGGQVP